MIWRPTIDLGVTNGWERLSRKEAVSRHADLWDIINRTRREADELADAPLAGDAAAAARASLPTTEQRAA